MPSHHKQNRDKYYTCPGLSMADHQPRIMMEDILKELGKARTKFPDQNCWITLSALTEEVGELNQAILQFSFEPHKGKTFDNIYKEAVQVAVMAIRVALDCEIDKELK